MSYLPPQLSGVTSVFETVKHDGRTHMLTGILPSRQHPSHVHGASNNPSFSVRNWVVKTRLAKAQAIIRGYFARKWYRAWRAQVRFFEWMGPFVGEF